MCHYLPVCRAVDAGVIPASVTSKATIKPVLQYAMSYFNNKAVLSGVQSRRRRSDPGLGDK